MSIPFAQMSFPEMYERELVRPLFQPFAELLLDAVAPRAGERLLDVACGTGIVARLAKERVGDPGRVVGVDVNAPMLAVARTVAQGIDWREGNASTLPRQEGERFDVVTCHQGLQFFPDRAAAVREMHRALVDGGRAGIATWRPDDEIPFGRELRRIAERHVGPIVDRRHGFGATGPLEGLLRDAGFRDIRSRVESRTISFPDGAVFVRMNAMALVGMSEGGKSLSESDRDRLVSAIVRDSADVLQSHSSGTRLAFELSTTLATAVR